jgi:uncharacterized protein YjbJ (UPF0337 family)
MGALTDKIRGRLKQLVGSLSGDRTKQAEGMVEEAKGKAKQTVEDIKNEIHKHE